MPLWHSAFTIRSTLKGYTKRFLGLYSFTPSQCKVMTTRHYLGLSRCSIPITDFKKVEIHINNAHFSTAFESARWESAAATTLNEDFFKARMHMMIAQTNVCFLRSLSPFTVVTIQTVILGITSSGRAIAICQSMYDDQNRLCSVAVYTKNWVCMKTKKTVMIREGLERMNKRAEDMFLMGDVEMTSVDDLFVVDDVTGEKKPTEKFQIMLDRIKKDPLNNIDLSGFEPGHHHHHKLASPTSVLHNAEAVAKMNYASMIQRKWNSLGKASKKK